MRLKKIHNPTFSCPRSQNDDPARHCTKHDIHIIIHIIMPILIIIIIVTTIMMIMIKIITDHVFPNHIHQKFPRN